LKVAHRLLKKKLGFRYLIDLIPLDSSLVKGSHGTLVRDSVDAPLVVTRQPHLLRNSRLEVREILLFSPICAVNPGKRNVPADSKAMPIETFDLLYCWFVRQIAEEALSWLNEKRRQIARGHRLTSSSLPSALCLATRVSRNCA